MQYKIPQNVQMADKIVGPLTLKHMIIIGAGGGLAYVIYIILAKSYFWEIWLPPVAIILIITALIAFVKIYNVSFGKFFLLFIEFNFIPRKRRWIKSTGEVIAPFQVTKKPTMAEKKSQNKSKNSKTTINQLDDLTSMLDTYGKKLESYNENQDGGETKN